MTETIHCITVLEKRQLLAAEKHLAKALLYITKTSMSSALNDETNNLNKLLDRMTNLLHPKTQQK